MKDELGRELPADWFEDSSLETWFPLTAEELARLKAQAKCEKHEWEIFRGIPFCVKCGNTYRELYP